MRKLTIDHMCEYARLKGGQCLSKAYEGHYFSLQWRCKKGHVWLAAYNSIKRGSWCPICAKESRKSTIEDMQKIALLKGGICLSGEYVRNLVKLQWQCAEGHTWWATPNSIKRGSWCQNCWFSKGIIGINKKHSLEEAKDFAKTKGGNCLSVECKNSQTPMLWSCEYNHTWVANFNAVVNTGTWCPKCAGREPGSIEDAKKLAAERGGHCLSESYVNNKQNLLWSCANGHEWLARYDNVRNGTWCPKCSRYYAEEKCRFIFESLLDIKFIKTRQPLNGRYELDGYNQQYSLAFEYHGEQHYQINKKFMKDEKALAKRKQADKEKRMLCAKLKINLIEIPYWVAESDDNLIDYISSKVQKIGIKYSKKKINLSGFYPVSNILEELRALAKTRGGKCLAESYISNMIPIEWECGVGHRWFATPASVKPSSKRKGSWCRKCARLEPYTIEIAKTFAKEKGGECLSNIYINSALPLRWICKEGHTWETAFGPMVQKSSWCRKCAQFKNAEPRKLGIIKMHELANEHGGKCLSGYYINSNSKLTWQCDKGHTWESTPSYVKSGRWCKICSCARKKTK